MSSSSKSSCHISSFVLHHSLESPSTAEQPQESSISQAPLSRDGGYRSLRGSKDLVPVAPCNEKFPEVPLLWEVNCTLSPNLTLFSLTSVFNFLYSSATLHFVDVMSIWTRTSWSEDIGHKIHCGTCLELSLIYVWFKKTAFYILNKLCVTSLRLDPQHKFKHI